MDPNTALQSILCGHMMFDHAEALQDWLLGGGFAPEVVYMPCDKHEFFAAHCERAHGDAAGNLVNVKADKRGIYTQAPSGGDWMLAGTWKQLGALEDSAY